MEFEQGLELASRYAWILKPRAMNLLSGKPDPGYGTGECEAFFKSSLRKSSLRKAGLVTRELGIQLLKEPVNTLDQPGFFLCGSRQTVQLIDDLPEIDLLMQYDLYQMQIMECDLYARLPQIINRDGHIQFSDGPARTEPGLGCIDFETIFELVDRLDYDDYFGAGYFPTTPTIDSLGWFRRYRQD